MNKIVSMPIKKQWFNMILRGIKKEEYMEIKEHWRKRLLHDKTTHLKLINGYGKDKPYLLVELKNISIRTGKEEWGAVPGEHYYVLELGEIIATGNLKYRALDKIKTLLDLEFITNSQVIKEGTVGEINEVYKYKTFERYSVRFENYDDLYILEQDQFTKVY